MDALGPHDARLAGAARHDGRVGRLAAARRENSFGRVHAVDVVRIGLFADEDDLFAPVDPFDGCVGVQHDLAHRGAG